MTYITLLVGARQVIGRLTPRDEDEASRGRPLELPPAPEGEEIVFDYATLRLTLRRHPLALLRPALARRGFMPAEELWEQRDGDVRNLIAGHLEDLTPLFGAHRRRERQPGIPLTWPAAGQFLRDVFVRSLPLGR